ncbi:MAG TPA: hypothetical protein PKA63_02730 [Oligoflexia bacterium]|nr:hypothetical protein [Oligoflexia bacterium]HMP47568.1 hypothetical protein [Oligoflexia bacterium]
MALIQRLSSVISQIFWSTDKKFRFQDQGAGIKVRSRQFKDDWKLHLDNSKSAIRTFLDKNKSKKSSISVLGAGTLLDFPIEILKTKNMIYLQDANPAVLNDWYNLENKNSPQIYVLLDVTGLLELYRKEFLEILDCKSLNDCLRKLKKIPSPLLLSKFPKSAPFIKTSHVISLNILSQLPIYWQDYVFANLRRRYGSSSIKQNELEIIQSLQPSSRLLVENHLSHLMPVSKNERAILITDINYFYTNGDISLSLNVSQDKPNESVSMYEISIDEKINNTYDNLKRNEIVIEKQEALSGISIDTFLKSLPTNISYTILGCWLWPISRNQLKRTWHQVVAIEFFRNDRFQI